MKLASLRLLAVTLLFGSTFIVGKHLVGVLPPVTAAALRYLLAAIIMLPFMKHEGRLLPRRSDLPRLLLIGVTGVFLYNVMFFGGLQFSTASAGALLIPTLNPLISTLLAAFLLRERMTWQYVVGIGMALSGAVLLITQAPQGANASNPMLGNIFYLVAVAGWAVYVVVGKALMERYSSFFVTGWAYNIGALLLTIAALFEQPWQQVAGISWSAAVAMIYLAGAATVLAYTWYNDGIRILGVGRATSFLYLVPFNAVVMAWAFLGERASLRQLLGGAFILLAVVIINRAKQNKSVASGVVESGEKRVAAKKAS